MITKNNLILGIESSCDDTSIALIQKTKVLANITADQKIHQKYGGVVPELASRSHQQNIIPVLDAALSKANVSLSDIDGIAFTQGPGLMGSLIVGVSLAKGLSLALQKPLIPVHHMKAHILAHFIEDETMTPPEFPFLCLTVSGGHTQLVLVHSPIDMEIIGTTIDDAVGEAFDKTAKMLGLTYPGGPLVDKYAATGSAKFSFSKPRVPDFNYSFSGIKTSVLYQLKAWLKEDPNFIDTHLSDLCASIQKDLIDILMDKFKKAQKKYKVKHVAISGGVSANSGLRNALALWAQEEPTLCIHVLKFEYCTDNAAMIAMAGQFLFEANRVADCNVSADPRLNW